MELQKGRPKDCATREPREIKVYDLLDSLGIEYWRIDHPPAANMEVCAQIDSVLGAIICKNLFLCNRQKTQFYLLMIPADKKFKTKDLSHQLGCSRLSFADAEDMEKYLDILPGSVSLMGLMNDKDGSVKLLVDKDVLLHEWLGCHPCVNTSSIRLKTSEAFGAFLDAVHHSKTIVELNGEEA